MARRWSAAGHDVTVMTSVYDKSDFESKGLISTTDVDGIKVLAINVKMSNKHGALRRLSTFLAFIFFASWLSVWRAADVVVASSGPLTVGIPGLLSKWVRRRPFVFEIRDLFAEGVDQMGVVTNRVALKLIHTAEVFFCRAADLVVALSPGMSDWVSKHAPKIKVITVTNAADNDLFGKAPKAESQTDCFRVVFTGSVGPANNCELILDAAEILMGRDVFDVRFEIIGDGKEKPRIQADAGKRGLTNVLFRGLMPKTTLAGELSSATVSLLTLRPIPVFDTVSPNKLFDALAAGVPVVQTTQGWIKVMLEESDCGLTVSGDDPEGLVEAVLAIVRDPDRRAVMSANAQRVARERFDRGLLAGQMLEALGTLVADGR